MEEKSLSFLEEIVEKYVSDGGRDLQTRFPPEPNGYLHIGHAKSICLNFGLAAKYGGRCNLRFDDTNPVKEDVEYVDSIKADIRWLGFDWALERYASDYFEQLYDWATELIRLGEAYVDDQTQEQIRAGRGTITRPGADSPWRDRSVEENLDLFARMRAGEFADGSRVLRARIDMAHPNMLFRDPILYRILHTSHHRTGDKWCIYPMYDFAHGQSDSIERITHSICTLEFAVHRPLYDWFIERLGIFPSHQYEFARLNLTYTMMSKRKLRQLVDSQVVGGWDDPRMPTISGMRRRGYTPASIRAFAERVGVAKRDNVIDLGLLEYCVREDLNRVAQRRMAVVDPLRVVITNWEDVPRGSGNGRGELAAQPSFIYSPGVRGDVGEDVPRGTNPPVSSLTSTLSAHGDDSAGSPRPLPLPRGVSSGRVEMIRCVNNPEDESAGTREVPLTKEIYIERDDFMEEPPKKFFRLAPGGEVRLRYGYLIKCREVIKDASGEIVELRCTYDPLSGGGGSSDGRRVKGVIHWVSAPFAVEAEARLYNPLFTKEDPEDVSTPALSSLSDELSEAGGANVSRGSGNGRGETAAMSSHEERFDVGEGSGENVPRGTSSPTPSLTSALSAHGDDPAFSPRPLPLLRGTTLSPSPNLSGADDDPAISPRPLTGTFLDNLNPESLVRTRVLMEPSLAGARVGETFQFERIGYFCVDADSGPGAPVFNRTVTLKDSWAKRQ